MLAEGWKPAGIFVPWAGPTLQREDGVYYLGIATDGHFGNGVMQTIRNCLMQTAECTKPNERSGQPTGYARPSSSFARRQYASCVKSLRSEFSKLRRTLSRQGCRCLVPWHASPFSRCRSNPQ
jgi:hypothetical protein